MKKDNTVEIFGFSEYSFNKRSKLRTMDYHKHNSVEISYVVMGELLFEYFDVNGEHQSFYLVPNQIAISKPFVKHKTSVSIGLQSMGLELVSTRDTVQCIKSYLGEGCPEINGFFDSFDDVIILHDTVNVQNTLRQFKNYLNSDGQYSHFLTELEIKKLFVQIVSCSENSKIAKRSNRHVNNAILYIKQNFNKYLSADMVASHLELSSVYFQKLFHQETGIKFTRYVNEQRIAYAITLLMTTSHTIDKIAQMVGYSNTQNFINNFKAIKGTTPKKFREQVFDSFHVDTASQVGSLYQESVFKND